MPARAAREPVPTPRRRRSLSQCLAERARGCNAAPPQLVLARSPVRGERQRKRGSGNLASSGQWGVGRVSDLCFQNKADVLEYVADGSC